MEFGSPNDRTSVRVASWLRYWNAEPHIFGSIRQRYRLSPAQTRVALLLADRLTNKEIATQLGIKSSTARRHTEAVLLRLGVNSRFKVVTRLAEFFEELEQAS